MPLFERKQVLVSRRRFLREQPIHARLLRATTSEDATDEDAADEDYVLFLHPAPVRRAVQGGQWLRAEPHQYLAQVRADHQSLAEYLAERHRQGGERAVLGAALHLFPSVVHLLSRLWTRHRVAHLGLDGERLRVSDCERPLLSDFRHALVVSEGEGEDDEGGVEMGDETGDEWPWERRMLAYLRRHRLDALSLHNIEAVLREAPAQLEEEGVRAALRFAQAEGWPNLPADQLVRRVARRCAATWDQYMLARLWLSLLPLSGRGREPGSPLDGLRRVLAEAMHPVPTARPTAEAWLCKWRAAVHDLCLCLLARPETQANKQE